ncbi:nuclear transport factor 2 family protein [Niveispirillum sp. SYP-B3756]|uniref:nuclear transport factor 2 family protein n=1 Tax=Niveispirillum sp. SYP-B3756 TaxID=2662178 RepID=UPI001563DF7E|nr:nuclear transport factor 2 family protein [Niveispirillum sp. SYP-B3756]
MTQPSRFAPDATAAFTRYIAAFNDGDFATACSYYADNIRLTIGNGRVLQGREEIVRFYTDIRRVTRRTITVLDCFASETRLAAELESEFLAVTDVPDFTSSPLRQGDRMYINSFAFYDIDRDHFSRIRAAVFRRVWKRRADPV